MKYIFLIILIFCTGCVSSKVTMMPIKNKVDHKIESIALAPSGGLLADAVGIELSNRGFNVIDSSQVTSLMIRYDLSEIEINQPAGLNKLRDNKIDAVLSVKSSGGTDARPQSASARISSTYTGKIITGVTWQNGYGGMEGSMADRSMRKGLNEAASQIADALTKAMSQ